MKNIVSYTNIQYIHYKQWLFSQRLHFSYKQRSCPDWPWPWCHLAQDHEARLAARRHGIPLDFAERVHHDFTKFARF